MIQQWIVPKYAGNADAAKEFLLHHTANFASATYFSEMYDLPGWPSLVPQLDGWLDNDPWGAKPANKLSLLKKATSWSANIGYPGPSNPAIGEIFNTNVLPTMFGRAARGQKSRRMPSRRRRTASTRSSRTGAAAASWAAEPMKTVEVKGLVKTFDGHVRARRGGRTKYGPWTGSISRRSPASTWCCSGRPGAGRRRCCARSRAWSTPRKARC